MKTRIQNFCFVFIVIMLTSCSHTSYIGFTTPKNNIENVPKVLSSVFFNDPNLTSVRICEFDKDNYMGFVMSGNSTNGITSQSNVKIFTPAMVSPRPELAPKVKYGNTGKIKYVHYFPVENESDIITMLNMFDIINKIKKNKNIEIYSQTGDFNQKYITVLYK